MKIIAMCSNEFGWREFNPCRLITHLVVFGDFEKGLAVIDSKAVTPVSLG